MERARRALEEGDYPETVFHAQQRVEKVVKAMIEAKREYVYNHGPRLASIFARVFESVARSTHTVARIWIYSSYLGSKTLRTLCI